MLSSNLRVLMFGAAVLLSQQCGAAMLQVNLTDSNVPAFPDGNNYLQLTILDGSDAAGQQIPTGNGTYTATPTDVVFKISATSLIPEGSKFGLDEFAFNTTISPLSTYASGNFVLPSGWSVAMGKNADGYGMFNLLPTGSGANTTQNPLVFAITGISADSISTYEVLSTKNAGEGNQDFAAHVINISGGTSSAWFGGTPAPVPVPGAFWSLLAGLGTLGLLLRRRPLAPLQPA